MLLILQAAAPVPRQGPDIAAGASHSVKKNSNNDKNPATQPQTSVKPIATGAQENSSKSPETKNPDQQVKIKEFPVVSIEKDWIDRGIWVFNGLLVIVGFLQWYVIRRQAKLMQEHAEHLKNLAVAAKDNAIAARLNAEAFITESRPWLLIHKDMKPDTPHRLWESVIRVRNFGKTPAKVIACKIDMQIGVGKETPADPEFFNSINMYLSPFFLPQQEDICKPFNVTDSNDLHELGHGRKHLWLCGWVKYQSTFASPKTVIHETKFCLCAEWAGGQIKWARGPDKYNEAS